MATKEPVKLKSKAEYFNRPLPLSDHFIPLIGDKREVRIVDIGSGPYPITGQHLVGVRIEIHYCDNHDPTDFWTMVEQTPMFPIEYQDMEKLTYPDNSFDIVNCVNALDHTRDALSALKEMLRVVKPGGWIYIDCALDQHTSQRKRHYWDAKEDGTFVNETDKFDLKDFGFSIENVDNGGERQYNHIIAKLKKAS